MDRAEYLQNEFGREVPPTKWNSLIVDMNKESESFLRVLSHELSEEVFESYYFFLGRLGRSYEGFSFNWEAFRDFAGPLLRSIESVPVVLISSDDGPVIPQVEFRTNPRSYYAILISPICDAKSTLIPWIEALSDAKAIPNDGGLDAYGWFLRSLGVLPEHLSSKARAFIDMFAEKS